MLDAVFVKNYPAPPVDEREILRYAGYKADGDGRGLALIRECLAEAEGGISYRVCYRVFDARALRDRLGESRLLDKRLCGAKYALLFAATVGLGIDRAVAKYKELSPVKALVFQAIGAERIESLLNVFCEELKNACLERGYYTGARFSAGYGDLPLETQKTIFALLDCPRKIGVSLSDSLIMTPTKSVTAIVAVSERAENRDGGCDVCEKRNCTFRKTE